MRKPAFAYAKYKGADQVRGKPTADKHLCFPYVDSKSLFFPNPKYQASSHLLWCYSTARFVSDLVGNPEDRFLATRLSSPTCMTMCPLCKRSCSRIKSRLSGGNTSMSEQ